MSRFQRVGDEEGALPSATWFSGAPAILQGTRWARSAAILLTLLFSHLAWAAPADLVLIIRAGDTGPRLQEAIHRLRGELTQHGFQVAVIDAQEPPSASELERRADEAGAVASVALVTASGAREELEKVDVWMSDRITGKTLKRTLTPERSAEAPMVLAVRTLDLLRSSFAEPKAHSDAPEIEGVHPERASHAVAELRSPSDQGRWVIGVGATLGVFAPAGAAAGGAQLSGGFERGRLGGRVLLLGLLGAEPRVSDGQFSLMSATALAEPYASVLRSKTFDLDVFPSVGATYLQVRGNVESPFQGRDDSTWVVSVGGGFRARYFTSPHFGFFADARALVMLPTPTVEIGTGIVRLGSPLLTFGLGFIVAL